MIRLTYHHYRPQRQAGITGRISPYPAPLTRHMIAHPNKKKQFQLAAYSLMACIKVHRRTSAGTTLGGKVLALIKTGMEKVPNHSDATKQLRLLIFDLDESINEDKLDNHRATSSVSPHTMGPSMGRGTCYVPMVVIVIMDQ